MKIEFTPKAQDDLSTIWDYTIQQWGVAQAESYIRKIWATIESLNSSHNAAQDAAYIRADYRKVQSGAHVIFFKQTSTTITVIRILQQRMDIERNL